jgi:hypothetical protein
LEATFLEIALLINSRCHSSFQPLIHVFVTAQSLISA